MTGTEYGITLFVILGTCIVFVAVWVFKSEQARNALKEEIEEFRIKIEKMEREKNSLQDELEDKISVLNNLEEQGGLRDEEEYDQIMALAEDMSGKVTALTEENERLKDELTEASASLAEIYEAVHGES